MKRSLATAGCFISCLAVVSILRAETASTNELALRREAEAKISQGDYAGAEAILAQLKSINAGGIRSTHTKAPDAEAAAKPAPSPKPEKPKQISFFDWLNHAGFILQRAAGNPGEGDGAEFAFLRDFQTDITTYTANFFLSFSPNRIRDPETNKLVQPSYHPFGDASDLKIDTSVEAKLTSDATSKADDALRFRLSGTLDTSSIGGLLDSTYTTFSFKSESDQHFEATRLSAEIWFTPTKAAWAIGRYQPQPANQYPILFRWRPYLGADLGGEISSASSTREMSQQRLIFRATGEILFPFLSKSLHLLTCRSLPTITFITCPRTETATITSRPVSIWNLMTTSVSN